MILSFVTVCLKIFMKHIGRFVFHKNIQMWKKQINWCNDIFIETFLIFNSKKNHRNINRFFTKIYNLKMLASFLQSEVTRNTSQILFNVIVRVLFNAKKTIDSFSFSRVFKSDELERAFEKKILWNFLYF